MTSHLFRLTVRRVEQVCLFELSWGQGQSLSVRVNYPTGLSRLYEEWQRAYLNFYQSSEMRGRAVGSGVAPLKIDWHAELVKAETKLIYEFHRWLRGAELYDIRAKIALTSQQLVKQNPEASAVSLFLTCDPIDLARLPWETWEIASEFAETPLTAVGGIQIIRAPLNIEASIAPVVRRQGRTRILVILGDDTGLNFQADREAVQSLLKIADVQFVGWQPDYSPQQVSQQIAAAIADEQGWDILFFAGHSNETEMTGGELGIAPGKSISIREIAPQLLAAKQRGLQVAIFNSCSGINIADSLIDLGFRQVVVMREPIHNRVAQEFLVRFLQGLAKHQDIQQSVLNARQQLYLEKQQSYPSVHLIPSLFCHPSATPFKIPPFRWKERLWQGLPNRVEAIALAACTLLSLMPPVQNALMQGRLLTQTVYRDVTAQLPPDEPPPIALVQIDTPSIYEDGITQIHPFDRSYLAKLVDRLGQYDAQIIGLDFILDIPQTTQAEGNLALGKAVRQAVDDQQAWVVFAADLINGQESGARKTPGLTDLDWSVQGYVNSASPYHVALPAPDADCRDTCHFAYLLATIYAARLELPPDRFLPQPDRDRTTSLRTELFEAISRYNPTTGDLASLQDTSAHPISLWTPWLRPVIDFSVPPQYVYQRISAKDLLDSANKDDFSRLPQQIALIAPGDDDRLGPSPDRTDRFARPLALAYWHPEQPWLTGGESLAYMVHHLLNQRLVIPIPDLWMVGLAVLLGKGLMTGLRQYQRQHKWTNRHHLGLIAGVFGGTVAYGALSLQLYITSAVLLPWLLPSSVIWSYVLSNYVLLSVRRKRNG